MHSTEYVGEAHGWAGGLRIAPALLAVAISLGFVGCTSSTTTNAPQTATSESISALSFDPDPVVIRKGESQPVKLNAVMGDGKKTEVSKDAQWSSENPATATVDNTGKVVGGNVGVTTVDATYKGTRGQVKVTVEP